VPYAALAEGRTVLRGYDFTMHTKTNLHVARKFVDCEIEVEGDLGEPCRVMIKGIGLRGE
jgi:RNA 3'-terminal phosphate cyclase